MSGPSMRRNSPTSSGTRSRWSSQTLYGAGTSLRPSMFEIEARGGLGRKGIWTRADLALTTPLVLFVHQGSRAAPTYAEGLLVAERTGDPRFQIRVGGTFFAPRPADDPDDLPPAKGIPRSLADLEIPQETVAGEWAVVAGDSDLVAAKSAGAVFLANGPEFERSPREFVAAVRGVREVLGPSKVVGVTGLATPSNLAVLVYSGIDVVDSSRMLLDSARGLFHTGDGTVPFAEADRDACGCPACAAGEALPAHNDRALYREMLLVRNHLVHGRLRELVERRLANAPWNTAIVRHVAPWPDPPRTRAILSRGSVRHPRDRGLEPRRGRDGHRRPPGVPCDEPVRHGRGTPGRGGADREGGRAQCDSDFEGTAHLGRIPCVSDRDAEPGHVVGASGPKRPTLL